MWISKSSPSPTDREVENKFHEEEKGERKQGKESLLGWSFLETIPGRPLSWNFIECQGGRTRVPCMREGKLHKKTAFAHNISRDKCFFFHSALLNDLYPTPINLKEGIFFKRQFYWRINGIQYPAHISCRQLHSLVHEYTCELLPQTRWWTHPPASQVSLSLL